MLVNSLHYEWLNSLWIYWSLHSKFDLSSTVAVDLSSCSYSWAKVAEATQPVGVEEQEGEVEEEGDAVRVAAQSWPTLRQASLFAHASMTAWHLGLTPD